MCDIFRLYPPCHTYPFPRMKSKSRKDRHILLADLANLPTIICSNK